MRICAYLPVFDRKDFVIETFRRLKAQSQPFYRIVAVGSTDEDKETAVKCGVDYIAHANQPLSEKIQAGVAYLRQFEPDGIMGIGSDDWPTENWVEELSPSLEEFDVVGPDHLYFFKFGSSPTEVLRYFYPSIRYGEPMGVGRFISKKILRKINWSLYPPDLRRGLDGASNGRMMAAGATTFLYKADTAKILCPKGIAGQLTSWGHGTRPDHSKRIHDPLWMQENFPDLRGKGLI